MASANNPSRILIVDDEAELLSALCEALTDEGFDTVGKNRPVDALQVLEKEDFDLVLTDLMMPGMDGIELLRRGLKFDPNLVGIVTTGQGTIQSAIQAMKTGAFDYVLKPFELQTMLPILQRALEVRRLRMENIRLKQHVERLNFESPRYEMIGSSPVMRKIVHLIEKVASTDATVLIRGSTGTGKELVARALHHNSARRDKPLVTVNCAALQETLLESEVFGHERGSFTGATQAKPGLIEVAEGGTLFIDEVAEMSGALQAKLLRVLEDGHFRRVGSVKECNANVRIIAATNKPLEEELKSGKFREDLYYRLNVVTIDLPPLCERHEDLPALIDHFLTRRQIGKVKCSVDAEAMQSLLAYDWPGNIRELANVLERAQILAENNVITLDDLPDSVHRLPTPASVNTPTVPGSMRLRDLERHAVQAVLRQQKGNKSESAKLLGINRRALYRLIAKYGLDDPGGTP